LLNDNLQSNTYDSECNMLISSSSFIQSTLYNSNLHSTVTEVVRCILVVMETWLQNGLCCVGESNGISMPTIGFSKCVIQMRNYTVTFYDLGGSSGIRDIWKNYYAEIHGLIFVIDGSDWTRTEENRFVLGEVLNHEWIHGKPLLVEETEKQRTVTTTTVKTVRFTLSVEEENSENQSNTEESLELEEYGDVDQQQVSEIVENNRDKTGDDNDTDNNKCCVENVCSEEQWKQSINNSTEINVRKRKRKRLARFHRVQPMDNE
ncbi:ADP-ribosylation factor-like protein 13B, partial [Trichinella britovi]